MENKVTFEEIFEIPEMNPVTIKINLKPYAFMYHAVQAAPGEVSGLGRIEIVDGCPTVKQVILLEQVSSGGHTDLDGDALTDFLYNLAVRGGDPSEWNFWWHSHGGGGVFWSGTDESNIARHSQKLPYTSIVWNKAGHCLGRMDTKGTRVNAEVVIVPTGCQEIQKAAFTQVRKRVREWKPDIQDNRA